MPSVSAKYAVNPMLPTAVRARTVRPPSRSTVARAASMSSTRSVTTGAVTGSWRASHSAVDRAGLGRPPGVAGGGRGHQRVLHAWNRVDLPLERVAVEALRALEVVGGYLEVHHGSAHGETIRRRSDILRSCNFGRRHDAQSCMIGCCRQLDLDPLGRRGHGVEGVLVGHHADAVAGRHPHVTVLQDERCRDVAAVVAVRR